MSGKHSLLSPSASERWLNCPPSARLTEDIVEEESIYAEEGTEAHALCEFKVNSLLGLKTQNPRLGMKFFDAEMEDSSDDYAAYIEEVINTGACSFIQTEMSLDISSHIPDCRGTGDCVAIVDKTLHIIDFKYGKGIEVSAEHNTQLMIYALGALDLLDEFYEIEDVSLSIFQPRISNIATWNIKKSELLSWGENELKPKAELAFNGNGEQSSGPWCRFCKLKLNCRKRTEDNLALAKFDFKKPATLQDEELSEVLNSAEELSSWCDDIKEYATSLLLSGGSIEGFKLVEGRSIRKYSDEESVAKVVEDAGYNPYEQKVLGITAMTGLLGKKRFNELLSSFIVKPQGKPTLAKESDKRSAININDFNDNKEKSNVKEFSAN